MMPQKSTTTYAQLPPKVDERPTDQYSDIGGLEKCLAKTPQVGCWRKILNSWIFDGKTCLKITNTRWWFPRFFFGFFFTLIRLGEMSQFDEHIFSKGLKLQTLYRICKSTFGVEALDVDK